MAEPIKVPYEETAEEYAARIRDLVENDRVGGARKLVAEAIERFPDHPALTGWQKALARAQATLSPATGVDRSAEFAWIQRNASSYRGQWVAVLGDKLLAHAATAGELASKLDVIPTDVPPFLHRIS
ncbi:MAG TPA: DUF5678 domain-containing protein [Thermoanaerobaculia bacterium]|nr:DUF5678 domain-containing protein [Thermoanaerobaculia bacterium]